MLCSSLPGILVDDYCVTHSCGLLRTQKLAQGQHVGLVDGTAMVLRTQLHGLNASSGCSYCNNNRQAKCLDLLKYQ